VSCYTYIIYSVLELLYHEPKKKGNVPYFLSRVNEKKTFPTTRYVHRKSVVSYRVQQLTPPHTRQATRTRLLPISSVRAPPVAGDRSSASAASRRRRDPSAEMGTRHLITGQNNCAPDGASSSNPFGALANALLGQSNKAEVSPSPIPAGPASPP
jgi:hypothetical protein